MTIAARPDPLTPLRSVLDEAFAEYADESLAIAEAFVPTAADPQPVDTQYALDGTVVVEGWVPTVPPPPHHCPDGICADLAHVVNCHEQAADYRTLAASLRDHLAETKRLKTARTKRVKALRRQAAGTP